MARNFNFHHPITASMHFNRAIICLHNAFTEYDGSFIFYASLELRVCIERLLIEYLVIMKADDKLEEILSEFRIKNLSKAIYEAEPEFDKKLEYTNFYLQTIGSDFELPIPDKNKLNTYYGKLGSYLHNFKKPSLTIQNQEWWNAFIRFLEEVRAFLFEYFKVPRAFLELNEEGFKLYKAYFDGSLTKEEIKKRIIEL